MLKIRRFEHLVRRVGGDRAYRAFMRAVSGLIFRAGMDADSLFWNYGYGPVDPQLPLPERLAGDATHAMLYHRLIEDAVAFGGAIEPAVVVDISAGRGGGSAVAALRFPSARVIATDIDIEATRTLRDQALAPNIDCVVCDGNLLPMASESAGLMIAVETIHHFEFEGFLRECRRILKPGGVLAVASTSIRNFEAVSERYSTIAGALGFGVSLRDVTANVLQAIDREPSHISRRVARLRWPISRLAGEVFIAPGSERHGELADGRRCYYFALLRSG